MAFGVSDKFDRQEAIGSLEETEAGVTVPERLLSDVCVVVEGRPIQEAHFSLMTDMYKHLVEMDKKPISRQAIRHWFKTGKGPQRRSALVFLTSYLESKRFEFADVKKISAQRRQGLSRLLRTLKRMVPAGSGSAAEREIVGDLRFRDSAKITLQSATRILINTGMNSADQRAALNDVVGTYMLYRMRFSYAGEKSIAREVVQITRSGSEFRFKYWFLLQGTEMAHFEGATFLIGSSIWLVGSSQGNENRLRVLQFKNYVGARKALTRLRWGIMLTDNSVFSGDPVSCKVVMIKPDLVISDIQSFCKNNVSNITMRELDERIRVVVPRLIDNNISSISLPNSIKVVSEENGDVPADGVLKTNQDTLENAAMILFKQ